MKKLVLFLVTCLAMISCGTEVEKTETDNSKTIMLLNKSCDFLERYKKCSSNSLLHKDNECKHLKDSFSYYFQQYELYEALYQKEIHR